MPCTFCSSLSGLVPYKLSSFPPHFPETLSLLCPWEGEERGRKGGGNQKGEKRQRKGEEKEGKIA